MVNSECLLKIGDTEYKIIANIGAMIEVEKISGKPFMSTLKEADSGSIKAIAVLLASCLSKDNKPVGMDFVGAMDFDVFEELTSPLLSTILKSFPDKKSGKKKVTVLTVMK